MKRLISLLLVACLIVTAFAGCGGSNGSSTAPAGDSGAASTAPAGDSGSAPAAAPDTVYTLQIGHAQPEDNPRHISLLAFKEMVEEQTGGGIVVEIYPAGQLGTEKEMLEAVKMGTLQGFRGGQFDFLPKLLIFSLPFLCENMTQIEALLNSDLAKEISEMGKEDNTLILGLGDAGGFRQFSNNVRPITQPADLNGLKMRTNGMDTIDRTFKAMGATTVSIPYNDLYMSLKTGVCDGQENPPVNVTGMKFYEVQNYFTIVNYQFHPDPFYVNLDWFESLPAEYQDILRDCTEEMMKINNQTITDNESEAISIIENNAEVYYPTDEELQAFKDAVQVVYDDYVAIGMLTQEELDYMLEIVANA